MVFVQRKNILYCFHGFFQRDFIYYTQARRLRNIDITGVTHPVVLVNNKTNRKGISALKSE